MTNTAPTRFRDRSITFANGSTGINVDVPSASPSNYHQVITAPAAMPRVSVDGKLFLPPDSTRKHTGRMPLVIVAPGSLGVVPSHLAHTETATNLGLAAFVLDSFGARDVTSTVANQTQFSFAASAYDVLAASSTMHASRRLLGLALGFAAIVMLRSAGHDATQDLGSRAARQECQ